MYCIVLLRNYYCRQFDDYELIVKQSTVKFNCEKRKKNEKKQNQFELVQKIKENESLIRKLQYLDQLRVIYLEV